MEGPDDMDVVHEDRDDHDVGWKLMSQGVAGPRSLPVQEVQSDLTRAGVDEDGDRSDDSELVEIGPFVVEIKDTEWRQWSEERGPRHEGNGQTHHAPGAGRPPLHDGVSGNGAEGNGGEDGTSLLGGDGEGARRDGSPVPWSGKSLVRGSPSPAPLPSAQKAQLFASVQESREEAELRDEEEEERKIATLAKPREEIQPVEEEENGRKDIESEIKRIGSDGGGGKSSGGGILKTPSAGEGNTSGWGINLKIESADSSASKGTLQKAHSEVSIKRTGPALWEQARLAFLQKRDESGVGGNEERRKVASMWSVALQATLKSGLGLFRRPGKRDFSIHGQPTMSKQCDSKQTQTVDGQLLPHLSPVSVNLREICEASGFAYGEIWLRQHRHVVRVNAEEEGEAQPSTGLRRSLDFTRLRRRSLDGLSQPMNKWAGIMQRHSSFHALKRTRSLNEHHVSHAPAANHHSHVPVMRQSSQDSHWNGDEEHEQLAKRLRWTGYTFAHTGKFEAGEQAKFLAPGWRDRLEEFRRQGEGRLQFYEKGKGFPGMAWARKELDWHDLAFLPEDDDLAADPRVMTAKTMFDFSVGVPVLDLDSGKLMAVVMLYHVATRKTHRPMQNYKMLSKRDHVTHLLSEFALMVFHSLNMHETAEELSQVISKHCFTAELQGSFKYPRKKEEKVEELDTTYTRLKHYWSKYLQKFRGQPDARIPQGHPWQFCLIAGIGTFIGIFAITATDKRLRSFDFDEGDRNPRNPTNRPEYPVMLINSFAAVAAMLFSASTSPLVQPRSLFGGHLIGAVVAVAIDHLSNPQFGGLVPPWVATPLAPATAIGIMTKTGLTHPPACAAAVIFMMGEPEIKNMGWYYILMPVLTDCVLLIIIAVVVNNLFKDRHYPLYW